jgi:uncharacterized membrane protein
MKLFAPGPKTLSKIYFSALLLSLTAVFVTVLLIMAHYENSSAGSFCNIDDYWNCDRVNKSSFAVFLGIPVSILGFLYYLFLASVFFALWKNYNLVKLAGRFGGTTFLLRAATMVFVLSGLGLTIFELTLTGANPWAALGRFIVLTILYILIFRFSRKNHSRTLEISGAVSLLALFGVGFSLYLTDIELFVLRAICVYCFTQQILILIIFALTVWALIKNKNDHANTPSS